MRRAGMHSRLNRSFLSSKLDPGLEFGRSDDGAVDGLVVAVL